MKIVMTGATGWIGRDLAVKLALLGHHLRVVSRTPALAKELIPVPVDCFDWSETSLLQALSDSDALIHLAGESIALDRWTPEKKSRIYDSRVSTTQKLMKAINQLGQASGGPKVIVSASAIGYYGDGKEADLNERSPQGHDFLAHVCADWENALFKGQFASASAAATPRLCALRTGIVLGRGGGALAQMLPFFKAGLGGPLGTGQQWMSWIHKEDLLNLYAQALENPKFEGVINAVSPNPVRNREFSALLGQCLNKPSLLRTPVFALKMKMGELASIILSSQKVLPQQLTQLDFQFKFPELKTAFMEIVGNNGPEEFLAESWIPQPIEKIWKFFSSAQNLEILTPPWLNFKVLRTSTPEIQEGTLIDYRLKIHGFPVGWRTVIEKWVPTQTFVDRQLRGPYKLWHPTHTFLPLQNGTFMRDQVLFRLPAGKVGKLFAGNYVRNDIKKIFAFRQARIKELFK